MQERGFLVSVCLVGFLAASLLGLVVLQHFPNSGDEWCYLLQAEIFSQGRLSAASPPHREFFDVGWMINNGKFYTQHPPGWPLVLALGVLAGVPWLVNPILGALTLLVIYTLGKKMYAEARVAMVATLLALCSPFFLFNSASYWAHSSSLLTLSLALLGFVTGLQRGSRRALILGGLCGSLSFLIRPLEQLAFLGACGLFCLLPSVRHRYGLKKGIVFLSTHLIGVLLLLGYHTLQNGHPLVTGYQLGYSAANGAPNIQLTLPTWHYIDDYLLGLLLWTAPGMPLLAGGHLFSLRRRCNQDAHERHWDYLMLLFCAICMVIYMLVAYPSLVGYGPRYYYSLLGVLALLAARGSMPCMEYLLSHCPGSHWAGRAIMVACLFLAVLGVMCTRHITHETEQLAQRLTLQRLINARDIHHAVVFLQADSGDFDPKDLTRNRLDFQGDVVYALDLGDKNRTLMEHYPGRRYVLYTYDEAQDRVTLRDMVPPPLPIVGR